MGTSDCLACVSLVEMIIHRGTISIYLTLYSDFAVGINHLQPNLTCSGTVLFSEQGWCLLEDNSGFSS